MKRKLARLACLAFGALLIAEILLPARLETTTVRSHVISNEFGTDRKTLGGPSYRLALSNAALSDCEVREETFHKLKDGDEVRVKHSPILRSCFYVASHDGLIDTKSEPRWAFGVGGGLLVLIGFGLLPLSLLKDDED